MAVDPKDQWARVEIPQTLVGRRAGTSARERAHALRAERLLRTLVTRALRIHTDERAWRKGANGERVTGFWLGRLPEGWFAFHDIPIGDRGANVDHFVVGPGGVFTINTKNLTGEVRVNPRSIVHNGHRTSFLPKAASEARRAAGLLEAALGKVVQVRGVLAILADEWVIKERPSDVFVGGPRGVKHWMLAQPAVLRSDEVIVIAAAASKPATWTTPVEATRSRARTVPAPEA